MVVGGDKAKATFGYDMIRLYSYQPAKTTKEGKKIEAKTAKEQCELDMITPSGNYNTDDSDFDSNTSSVELMKCGGCEPVNKDYYIEKLKWKDKDQPYYCTAWHGDDNAIGAMKKDNSPILKLVNGLLAWIVSGIAWLIGFIAPTADRWINYAFDIPDVLKDKVWVPIRDFVNIVFAMILVGIALMNILRVKMDNYAIKKALPALISGLILVNLSWIICMLFLDLGQIAYKVVLGITGQSELGLQNFINIDSFKAISDIGAAGGEVISQASIFLWIIFSLVMVFLMIVPLFQLFMVLLVRIVVLWILFAISPLAWLGFVIPEARAEVWGKFWKALMTMTFLPARVAFYFVIGILIKDAYIGMITDYEIGTPLPGGVQQMGDQFVKDMQSHYEGIANMNMWQAGLLFLMTVVIIKIAARDAMKNEYTEAAMNIGEKVGKWANGSVFAKAGIRAGASKLKEAGKEAIKDRASKFWFRQRSKGFKNVGRENLKEAGKDFKSSWQEAKGGKVLSALKSAGKGIVKGAVNAPLGSAASLANRFEASKAKIERDIDESKSDIDVNSTEAQSNWHKKTFIQNGLKQITQEQGAGAANALKIKLSTSNDALTQANTDLAEAENGFRKGTVHFEDLEKAQDVATAAQDEVKRTEGQIMREGVNGDRVRWHFQKASSLEAQLEAQNQKAVAESLAGVDISTITRQYREIMKGAIGKDKNLDTDFISKQKFWIQAYEGVLAQNGIANRERSRSLKDINGTKGRKRAWTKTKNGWYSDDHDKTAGDYMSNEEYEESQNQARTRFNEIIYGADAAVKMARLKATDDKVKEEYKQHYYDQNLQSHGVVKGDVDATAVYSVDQVLATVKKGENEGEGSWTREDVAFTQATFGQILDSIGGMRAGAGNGREAIEKLLQNDKGEFLADDALQKRISKLANLTGMPGATQAERNKTFILTQFQLDTGARGRGFAPILEYDPETGKGSVDQTHAFSKMLSTYKKADAKARKEMQRDVLKGFSKQSFANFEKAVDKPEMVNFFQILKNGIDENAFTSKEELHMASTFMGEIAKIKTSPQLAGKVDSQLWDKTKAENGIINKALQSYQDKTPKPEKPKPTPAPETPKPPTPEKPKETPKPEPKEKEPGIILDPKTGKPFKS